MRYIVLLLFLATLGCATNKNISGLDSGCNLELKGKVEKLKLDCNLDMAKDTDGANVGVGAGTK